jgi:rSAM/selenodomain-associated transferase 1
VYTRKLGIFVKIPAPGAVKTRLVPPLTPAEASELYGAFLADFFARLARLKKLEATVFYDGENSEAIEGLLPHKATLVRQEGDSLGERLENAFRRLFSRDCAGACVIGSDSPDLPLPYIKRAYLKLKRVEAVVGPTFDGGYYLIGLKRLIPDLFHGIPWGTTNVLAETLRIAEAGSISCAFLPPWYDVDDVISLSHLETMLMARRLERRDRLFRVERALKAIALRLSK